MPFYQRGRKHQPKGEPAGGGVSGGEHAPASAESQTSNDSPPDTVPTRDMVDVLYPELRRIAQMRMARERGDHILQPTALVNELFVQLFKRERVGEAARWASREHFLLAASKAMHNVLIDHARSRAAEKRGGGWSRVEIEDPADVTDAKRSLEMDSLVELITQLGEKEPRMADIVRLRYFGGLTLSEIGDILGVNERTIKRDWALARQWLKGHMTRE